MRLPFLVIVLLFLAGCYGISRWAAGIKTETDTSPNRTHLAIIAIGLFLIAGKTLELAQKHGVWDAWAIWNLHAAYLQNAATWQNMFQNILHAHPDYPLLLPNTIAFLNNILGTGNVIYTAFCFHFAITLLIPLLIYLQLHTRSFILAILSLWYFSTDDTFIMQGAYQLADVLLAFFYLSASIAVDGIKEDKKMAAVTAFLLGAAMWTKNEGIPFACLFCAFHARTLFLKQNIRYTLSGIALPLLTLLFFKITYAPANDIVNGQDQSTFARLTDISRYKLVYHSFRDAIYQYFYFPACAVCLSILVALVRNKMPGMNVLLVLACCLCYLLVYIITPIDLEWHLQTSIQRVLMQLMPMAMYASPMYFTGNSIFRFRATFLQGR
ncbi:MAG TPA: hypothetical protein VGD89_05785 [Flavipsychrobacter sp.]